MTNIKKLLGQRIKEMRKSKHLTQEQFAEMLDIDQRNLSAIECGINFPTKHFIKISEALNVELKELFDFDHLELTNDEKKQESKKFIDNLDSHDLNIVYKLLKSMNL